MGLFDFLHGGSIKSDAEIYMEQTNKEYAKRAAEYRRRESGFNVADKLSHYLSFGTTQNTTPKIMSTKNANQRSTYSNSVNKTEIQCVENEPVCKTQCENEPVCKTQLDPYNASLMNILAASANLSTRTVTISGTIARGRFSVGDTVTINTKSSRCNTTIKAIIRHGEKIQYANSAAGKIAIICGIIDDHICAGDTMTKKNLG